MALLRILLATGLTLGLMSWGPAAFAEDEDVPTPDEIENMADPGGLPSTDSDTPGAVVRPSKKASSKVKKPTKAQEKKAARAKAKAKPAPKAKEKPVKRAPKPAAKAKAAAKKPAPPAAESAESDDELEADEAETNDEVVDEGPEEQDPVKISANAKELSIRVLGLSKIGVARSARRYVPAGLEARLSERLLQDLAAKTYYEPRAVEGASKQRKRIRSKVF